MLECFGHSSIDSFFRHSSFEFRHLNMRILGIDPGLRITGYGVVDFADRRTRLVDGGVIRLTAKALADRLVELDAELAIILDEFHPDICAVEQLYSHYAHPRTAILMGHARGVILLAARRQKVAVAQFSANRIKKSVVGHGHAGKDQVQRAIQRDLKLAKPLKPFDVADALAVALCCGRQIGNGTA
jgi:crossover junction endodeoxyribonuclease RuvC